LLDELEWRGLLYDRTEGLGEALSKRQVSGYCGFDPTADSLHVGSLIPVMGLLHLQRAGHRPVILVGGGTGLIGDPSGKSTERPLSAPDDIAANTRAIRVQLERFLDFDGPHGAIVHNNAEWLVPLPAIGLLRDVGKHFSINYMLAKDSVKSRLDLGISFTEFSYMLLQAYDFLQLHQRAEVTLQIGGSDQWGNITAGIELIRRAVGAEAHGLVLPLVTTAGGTKFGKTEAGTVWLDPARTSPFQFFQFWINADDRDVGRYLRYFTLDSRQEILALDALTAEHPERRAAQQRLAYDVTARVHGDQAAETAKRVSAVLFGESATSLMPTDLDLLKAEMPSVDVVRASYTPADGRSGLHIDIVDLAVKTGILTSKSEARRLLQQGGLYVNDVRVLPENGVRTDRDLLHGRALIIRKGARTRTFVDFI
jgi:tyrosyl-tRNA synthetase